jgi:hypothetical protein
MICHTGAVYRQNFDSYALYAISCKFLLYFVFTERQNGSQDFEGQQHGGREAWGRMEEDPRFATTPPDGQFPMHNGGHVKFEVPKVPVIFVLGTNRLLLFKQKI